MRLFIAITFTEDMLDALSEIQDDLRRSDVRGSYTPRENLHMTLAFIGEYDDPEQIVEVMRKVPLRSFSIKLSGYQPFKDMIFANFEENENLRDYVKRLRKALLLNYTIVLDHQPYNLDRAEAAGVDFQLSGHTHRGQVWPISWITDRIYECSWGSHQRGSTQFYVSSGIGIWGGKFRIGTQSEYVVATLK